MMNTIHLVNGVSGSPFQSSLAHPPGEGLSPAIVNVGWGFANLVVAYLLLVRVGKFELCNTQNVVTAGAGMLITG